MLKTTKETCDPLEMNLKITPIIYYMRFHQQLYIWRVFEQSSFVKENS